MRTVAISLFALFALAGCVSLHANVPEEMVWHMARRDGMELGAICSQAGETFSEGAVVCMASQRMVCDATGRWIGANGGC